MVHELCRRKYTQSSGAVENPSVRWQDGTMHALPPPVPETERQSRMLWRSVINERCENPLRSFFINNLVPYLSKSYSDLKIR